MSNPSPPPFNTNPAGNSYHDPAMFRRNGKPRTGVGRFLYKSGPAIGRIAKGLVLGVVDGIPGVSQVVSTLTADKKINSFDKPVRIVTGWATVGLVGMSFALKMSGHIDNVTLLQMLRMFFSF